MCRITSSGRLSRDAVLCSWGFLVCLHVSRFVIIPVLIHMGYFLTEIGSKDYEENGCLGKFSFAGASKKF